MEVEMRLAAPACAVFTLTLAGHGAAQIRSVQAAAPLSRDAGTVFVGEKTSGIGGGVSLRLSFGGDHSRFEPEASIDVAGFSGDADGDPIFSGSALLAYKRCFGRAGAGARPWWSLGAGVGRLAIAGSGSVVPVRAALGVSLGHGGPFGLELSAFNRYAFANTHEDRPDEHINATGVELSIRFGR
jgi:hypothetical protein